MIIQDRMGNMFYISEEDVEHMDESGMMGITQPETIDSVGLENFFHTLPRDQMEVMICLYLGMKPKEIVEALNFTSVARFYNLTARLRKSYIERKPLFMS